VSGTYIQAALRERVAERGRHRCGYCLTQEDVAGMPMEIDHLIPQALGGPTVEDNLWLACSSCNARKGDRIVALDPRTGTVQRIFDPSREAWSEHFAWNADATQIIGQTPQGRATVSALRLNRPGIIRARARWVSVGWHPPIVTTGVTTVV